jgi:hypothetical protein
MLPNAQPKSRPRLLDKRQAKADAARADREQRAICRTRSGGRCEVMEVGVMSINGTRLKSPVRCTSRAFENHHLIGGLGRRNVGRSRLAEHRLDTCRECHQEITAHVLVPCVEEAQRELAATVRFERRK